MTMDPTQEFYEAHAEDFVRETANLQSKEFLLAYMQQLPTDGSVLDIGCASGRDALTLAQHHYRVTGIDTSSALLTMAKKNVPHAEFLLCDVRQLDSVNKTFDGVWAHMSLLHIPKLELPAVLEGIHKILKPNGIFALTMKEGEGEGLINDARYNGMKKYYSYFSQEELEQLLVKNNFTITRSTVRKRHLQYQDKDCLEFLAEAV